MPEMTVFIEDSFDSAHFLPNVPKDHKCARLHGHTYRIRIEISGAVDPVSGWVIDYAEIKTAWEPIKHNLDHWNLNEVILNPTCENIAEWIAKRLEYVGVLVSSIELRETVNCGVVWTR